MREFDSPRGLMKFPPKPSTKYALDDERNRRVFEKLGQLSKQPLTPNEQILLAFLYSQIEDDWQTPLEKFVDGWLNM